MNNKNGRNGGDPNAVDFFNDGSGSGNCFIGNSSSTFDGSGSLYPSCPAPSNSGTGTSIGDPAQFAKLIAYVASNPPENQQCSWTEQQHEPFEDFEPFEVTPGPDCP